MLALIEPDVEALGCQAEIGHLDGIAADGTSADRQIAIFKDAKAAGRRRSAAISDVIDGVGTETLPSGRTAA